MNPSNELDASELTQYALKYIHCNNKKEKDRLFTSISDVYMPYILSQMKRIRNTQQREDYLQLYYLTILEALDKWSKTANFDSYLFNYLRSLLRVHLNQTTTFKKELQSVQFSDISYDVVATDQTEVWKYIKSLQPSRKKYKK